MKNERSIKRKKKLYTSLTANISPKKQQLIYIYNGIVVGGQANGGT